MATYVTRIRTQDGESQIDYTALANLPKADGTLTMSGSFADAKATGDAIRNLETSVSDKAESEHTHSASDIASGYVPLSRGGTGAGSDLTGAPNNALIYRLKNDEKGYDQLYYKQTKSGALYATEENGAVTFGKLPLAQGGTGRDFATVLAEHPYAIVRLTSGGDDYQYMHYVDTANGAMYATQDKGMPQFGTLPVAQGGTGATDPAAARTNIGAASKISYTATLSTSGWSSVAPYTQSVTVNGILSTDDPIVDIDLSSATSTTISDLKDSWSAVDRIVTSNNKITAYCYEDKPGKDLKIKLMVVR